MENVVNVVTVSNQQSTEPKVIRILKRPTSQPQSSAQQPQALQSPQSSQRSSASFNSAPEKAYKSYETRSEEYMKARLRILGNCQIEETDIDSEFFNLNNNSKHQKNSASVSTNNSSNVSQGVNNLSTC